MSYSAKEVGPNRFRESIGRYYEDFAVELAEHPEKLAAIRQKLWDQRLACPLFDTERYVRHLERGYQLMWQNYLAGSAPQQFCVEA